MAKSKAFFKKLWEHPKDVGPRVAFADWLESNGNHQCAEFIRTQIALDPIRNRLHEPEVLNMLQREQYLLSSVLDIWKPAYEALCVYAKLENLPHDLADMDPTFALGFPRSVAADLLWYLNTGEDILRSLPTVETLSVYGINPDYLEHIFETPGFERVRVLEFMEPLRPGFDSEYHRVFDAMTKSKLEVLRLHGCPTCAPLHMMHILKERDSPVRIELVQLESQGMTAGYGGEANREYDQVASNLGMLFEHSHDDGWSAQPRARVIRPHEGRFCLQGKLNQYLVAGRTTDGKPGLAATNEHKSWHIARFNSAGQFVGEEDHTYPTGVDRAKYLIEQIGFQPGMIHISEFQTSEGMGLNLWPQQLWHREIQPMLSGASSGMQPNLFEISPGRKVRKWLSNNQFALTWSGVEYIGDGSGMIQPNSTTP